MTLSRGIFSLLLALFSLLLAQHVGGAVFTLKPTIVEGSYSFFDSTVWDGMPPQSSIVGGDTYNFTTNCVRGTGSLSTLRCLVNITNIPSIPSGNIILNGDVMLDITSAASFEKMDWNKGGLRKADSGSTVTIGELIFYTATQSYFDDSALFWLMDRVDLVVTSANFRGRVLITTVGTVSLSMNNIDLSNNGVNNQPYVRIIPRPGFGGSDATVSITGPLAIPGRSSFLYDPDFTIDAKTISFPTTFVGTIGARAYLRLFSQTLISWGTAAQITMHRDYSRFQVASSGGQSWSAFPKVVLDGTADPNAAPTIIWGAFDRLPINTVLTVDNVSPVGSEILETWFVFHNSRLAFTATGPSQLGPFNRVFMYPNTQFWQEGNPSSAKMVRARRAYLGTGLNSPLLLRWVNLNVTSALVDTLPNDFQFQDLPTPGENSKIDFISSRFIIAAGASAEFSRVLNLSPAAAPGSCSATTNLCGFENLGSATFRQTISNHNINVPFDNRGTFTFSGTNVNGNATIAIFLPKNIVGGTPSGGEWIFQVPASKPQFPAVVFNGGATPNGPVNSGYNFGTAWRFTYSVQYITIVAFLDGDYYFPSSGSTPIRNSVWRHATLEIDPDSTTELAGAAGVNFGARQRGFVTGSSLLSAKLSFTNSVTLTSNTSFPQPATYLIDMVKFEGSGFFSNWRMNPDRNYPFNVAFYEGNYQLEGLFFSEIAQSGLSVKFFAEPGARVNITTSSLPSSIDIVNRGLIRLLPSFSNVDTTALARIDISGVFVQESVGTLLLSYASPVTSGNQPTAGQYLRFSNSASVMNGTIAIQDPRRIATLSRGSYYVASLPRGNAAASVSLEYFLLNSGDTASARIVSEGSTDWVVVDVAQAASPASTQQPSADGGSNVVGGSSVIGPAVGGAIGAVVGLAAIIALIIFLVRRNKKQKQDKPKGDAESGTATANGQYGAIGMPMESKPKKRNDDGESETSEDAPPQYGSISGTAASSQLERSVSGIDQSKKLLKQKKADDWQIPFEDLSFDRELGSGAFGSVWKGQWNASAVAIKQSLLVSATASQQADFEHEAKLMTKLRPHPNVVHTWGLSVAKDRILLVMEYCARGSLTKYFGSKKNALTVEKKLRIVADLAKGISHLHKNKIVHRDIAARNVLLTKDWTAKISDFGMSRLIGNSETKGTTASNIGPVRWMAPESIKTKEYSPQTDVWSFGITVWEIFSECEPHAQLDMLDAAIKIRDEKITPPMLDSIPEPVQALLLKCWAANPDERPSFDEIIKDCTAIAGAEDSEESSSAE